MILSGQINEREKSYSGNSEPSIANHRHKHISNSRQALKSTRIIRKTRDSNISRTPPMDSSFSDLF